MKLLILLYLEEDEACVTGMLAGQGVPIYSRTSVEGIGPGAPGWYGRTAPYQSRMILALVSPERATAVLEAVQEGTGLVDSRHPIHALQLDVERTTACGVPPGPDAPE